ncbi:MAG: hypothetical protein M1814_004079 [Vezdaea aestivalis]|nr:MAG: hypothetical protein M1814_004079 [Vezdaea aestivalis]
MDALLSLPLLSYLVLPSFGAYSTSLNLLFFYLTWSTLILSHPPMTVEVIGTLAIRILFFIFPSLLFLLFDSALPSLSRSLKTQGSRALPTRTLTSRPSTSRRRRATAAVPSFKNPARVGPAWYLIIGLSLVNLILGACLQILVEKLLVKTLGVRSALKVTTALPFPWAIAKDLSRGFAAREAIQWVLHRYVLHGESEWVVSGLGHERVHHAVKAPFSFSAHYDHPLAWVVWRWMPVYGAAGLFRFHLLTWFVFLALVSVEECVGSAGYDLNSIVMGGLARRQDAHSETGGLGNYAPWGVLDWVFGSSVGADVMDDVREEWEKHDGREKAEGLAEGLVEGVRAGAKEVGKGRRRGRKADHE